MSDGSFKVDSSLFTKKSFALLKQIEKSEDEFLDEQAALLFRDASKFTPPFGGGTLPAMNRRTYGTAKDKKAGENAIRSDLSIVFRRREKGYLQFVEDVSGTRRNIRQTLRNKSGRVYLVDVDVINYDSYTAAEDWHRQMKRKDGRVKGHMKGGKDSKIGRWQARDRMWITPQIYNKLFKSLKSRVGRGKALFAWAAQEMGGKQAPKWISRHYWGYRARVTKGPGFRAARASAGQLTHTVRFLPRIERHRAEAAEKRLLWLTKDAIKKSGFKAA